MPIMRTWTAMIESPIGNMKVTFRCPYYNELLANETENGRLPKTEYAAHALWEYYGLASMNFQRAKKNLVEESELSLVFDQAIAKQLFTSIASKHNVKAWHMVRFWPLMDAQRIALGGTDVLPEEFKFRYWGN